MSIHYSRFLLNTYGATPYFESQIPRNYPLYEVLVKSRAFRRLPKNLRELSGLAKEWARRTYPESPAGIREIDEFYDDEGYELNPFTGKRLTDKEIDNGWDRYEDTPEMKKFKVEDIPIPEGGFADPNTWQKPDQDDSGEEDPDAPTEESLLRDIESHGREYVAKDYGVPLEDGTSDEDLAHNILISVGRG